MVPKTSESEKRAADKLFKLKLRDIAMATKGDCPNL